MGMGVHLLIDCLSSVTYFSCRFFTFRDCSLELGFWGSGFMVYGFESMFPGVGPYGLWFHLYVLW